GCPREGSCAGGRPRQIDEVGTRLEAVRFLQRSPVPHGLRTTEKEDRKRLWSVVRTMKQGDTDANGCQHSEFRGRAAGGGAHQTRSGRRTGGDRRTLCESAGT